MQIGEIIRKYRKEKNMTQEDMANRLGVTAPAVNKWENGKTMQDIMLLSTIARLLGISLDTLLSFREMREEFVAEVRKDLLNCFRDEETFGWLREDARWQELVRD